MQRKTKSEPPSIAQKAPRFSWLYGCLGVLAFLCAYAPQHAHAQANCENPNLLMILDQSCSMKFDSSQHLVRTSRSCGHKNQCSPMPRTHQPTPGQTPRYPYYCSSSRCSYTRWDVATNALKEVVYKYGGTAPSYSNRVVRFGLEYFSNNGSIARGITSNPPQIASSLSNTTANGGTNYTNAFTTARNHLISVVNGDSVKKRPTHILFITDGAPGDGCTTPLAIVRDLFNGTGQYRLQDNQGNIYKVKTYVIGFGSGLDANAQSCLNSLAQAGGTQRCNPNVGNCVAYFAADNDVQFSNAMTSIINNATQEVCDGLDNDCDGRTDEGITRNCTTACGSGTQSCSSGRWGACSSGVPSAERCNNRDDDCDGRIDENFSNKGQSCAVGQGTCRRTGRFVCNSAQTGTTCSARPGNPVAEKCDGLDNDCDGRVDENFNNKGQSCTVGRGECRRSGRFVCNSAQTGTTCSVQPAPPQNERCDGKDNDCDGRVDENWPNKGSSCTVGQGECKRSGSWVCTSNGSGVRCTATPGTPQTEKCDGKDNDCDGQVDEGCQCIDGRTQSCFSGNTGCRKTGSSYSCTAPCKSGTQTCANGRWGTCVGQRTAQAEKCNNKDDDCDGQVDENWSNKGSSCSVGTGQCKRSGTWRCRSNQQGVECSAKAGAPKAETCNNKDDDCDGQVDESLTQQCSTPCERGTEICQAGKWINCSARKPVTDVCDGKDNDCDGKVDEDYTQKGKTCYVGVGECRNKGTWQCKSNKQGVECSAQKGPPSKEQCDGKDNDCDGQTDEDFPKKGQSCTSGLGECKRSGTFICTQDGKAILCSSPAGSPSPEVCDNKDNNCNGKIDDGVSKACKSVCGSGRQTCTNGTWDKCDAPLPKTETCNNKDDDCDGKTDNGVTRPCTTICGSGTETCVAGKFVFCDAQKASKEICDGKDNDCDGKVDNNIPPKKCSGACGQGTATCQNGAFTGCSGPQPSPEVCDGKDNNCDGQIDENIGKDCRGPCGPGRQICYNGVFGECNATPPQPEACDGKDNDCDGVADNNAKCPKGTTCVEGQCKLKCVNGECPGGSSCSEGFCGGDLCKNIQCPKGQECLSGKCIGPCDLVTCPSKYVCEQGKCIKDDCYRNGCPGKQRCVHGVCEVDPCQDVTCASDQFCRDGKCKDSCSDVQCKTGEKCIDGKCRPDPKTSGPCENVQCQDGEYCDSGKCVSDPCHKVECPKGKQCIQGVCEHDPCLNIQCPQGQKCESGQCIKDPNPTDPENPNNGEQGSVDGGVTTDDPGQNKDDPNQTKDDPSTSDDPGSQSERKGNTDGKGNVTDTSIGGPNTKDSSSGGRYVPGCGCSSSTQDGPLMPILFFSLFLLAVGVRRKKQK